MHTLTALALALTPLAGPSLGPSIGPLSGPLTHPGPTAAGLQDGEEATAEAPPALPSDAQIRASWDALEPADQAEIAAWFSAECDYMRSTQNALIKFLLSTVDVDRGTLPEHAPLEPYDPEVHAPKQPIPRKWLDPDSAKAKQARETFAPDVDPAMPAYRYNWGTGQVERVADEDDPERIFTNGLLGLPPKTDYAEALLMQRLDDGELRATHLAFAHPYTDRSGNAFPGVTLYDAWGSGAQMEMPDVDVLGIVHDLLDEWKKWKAPVPGSQHDKLYKEVGDLWLEAYGHRSLREAFAHHYVRGLGVPANAYAPMALAFNAKWEELSSDPAELVDDLPDPEDVEDYTKDLTRDVARKKKWRSAGQVRLDYLEYERYQVKARLVWVMQQYGAL